jgi:glutathione synthase/RimK-type ligase-like ATP-grasp enzyme
MSVQLAVATSAAYPNIHVDDAHLAASLAALGIQLQVCVWNDPGIDWASHDAVLVRTIWDYFEHYDAFLAWLDRLERSGVPVINPVALMRWNSDKRYLLQLASLGVPTIPTRLSARDTLHEALAAFQGRDVVVKPCISGGAWRTVRGTMGDPAFDRAVSELPSGDYLVQPFVQAIVDDGEWSLLFFGGEFSHAVVKRPATGDYRVQEQYGGRTGTMDPDAATLAAARHALATCTSLGLGDASYARVDGVVVDGRFLLMELELIEPSLFLAGRPDASQHFARVIAARLESLRATKAPRRTESA